MKIETNNIIRKLACTTLSTILLCGTAYASTLHIKNDDTEEVDITVEAGDGNLVVAGKESIRLVLNEREEKTIEVTKQQLDKDTFSITGKVKIPSLYNKCGPLLISKNYKIIFTGSKTGGTICISELLN
jgi:hypothetical protein